MRSLLLPITKRTIYSTKGLRDIGCRRDAVEPSAIAILKSNQYASVSGLVHKRSDRSDCAFFGWTYDGRGAVCKTGTVGGRFLIVGNVVLDI